MNQASSDVEEKERKRDKKDGGQEADGKKGSPTKYKHIGGKNNAYLGTGKVNKVGDISEIDKCLKEQCKATPKQVLPEYAPLLTQNNMDRLESYRSLVNHLKPLSHRTGFHACVKNHAA